MENEQQQTKKYWFFGSKLNTALLLVLIILMVIALKWMFENKNTYIIPVVKKQYDESPVKNNDNYIGDNKDDTLGFVDISKQKDLYTYINHGFSVELPKGFTPNTYKSETLPTISVELPNKSYLIYITNADLWFKNNIEGQATYLRDEKVGSTTFKVYEYNGQDSELYIFRQGNVVYSFDKGSLEYMKTFKFIGWN